MQPIHKILVGIDSSDMDKTLANFISFLSKTAPLKDIYFLNVIKSIDDTYLSNKEIKKIDASVIENQKKILWKQVDEVIEKHADINVHLEVKTGSRLREFLKFIKKEDIDLVITGFKQKSKGSGLMNQRLARRAPCSLVIIPEGHKAQLKKLLVPIDFSKYAKLALDFAIYRSRSSEDPIEVICLNIYNVPIGYHYSGKSFDKFAQIMKENAEKAFKSWITRIDAEGVAIRPVFTLDKNDDMARVIEKIALEEKVTNVILGAKGRSSSSSIFIGSEAEKLVNTINYLPLTIVRPKGEIAGFMESLGDL